MQDNGWVRRQTNVALGKSLRLALESIGNPVLIQELVKPAIESWQRGDLESTEILLRRAELSTNNGVQALAQLLLADTFRSGNNVADAFTELKRAAMSANEVISSLAACELGNMYEEYGDIQSAQLAYQKAARSTVVGIRARALAHMAELMYFEGEVEEASEILRQVLPLDTPEWPGRAAGLLGDIRFSVGDLEGAYDAFYCAAKLDASEEADRAVVMLAVIIDAGYGDLGTVEDYAALDVDGAPLERRAYIEFTLRRLRDGETTKNPPISVNPAWDSYYRTALKYHTDHQNGN